MLLLLDAILLDMFAAVLVAAVIAVFALVVFVSVLVSFLKSCRLRVGTCIQHMHPAHASI